MQRGKPFRGLGTAGNQVNRRITVERSAERCARYASHQQEIMVGKESERLRDLISTRRVESEAPEFSIDFVTVSAQLIVIELGKNHVFRIELVAKRQASRAGILNDLCFAIRCGSSEFGSKERADLRFNEFNSRKVRGLQRQFLLRPRGIRDQALPDWRLYGRQMFLTG